MTHSLESIDPQAAPVTQSRRAFLGRLLASSTLLTLNYAPVVALAAEPKAEKLAYTVTSPSWRRRRATLG